jgi:hypothetical protein
MIRTIFLLAPVFMSLYWAVALRGDRNKVGNPRIFLSFFMLLVAVIFFAHFLYFANLHDLYLYFDVPLQFLGLTIFPIYHIYFRLLTVDERFSIKTHSRFLIFPVLVVFIYAIGVLFTPVKDYQAWLFNLTPLAGSKPINFLVTMRIVTRITFIIALVYSMIGNHWLLRKYGHKAEQFYSDIVDAKQNNARNINLVIHATGFASVLILSIGRIVLMPAEVIICASWTLFSVLIFLIGNSGIKQKVINPSVDPENREESTIQPIKTSIKDQELYWNKILEEFTQNKIYLNSNLNIMDLVKIVGTNRTYISSIINQKCNQNFCSFVNDFRIENLKFIHLENPRLNHAGLAQYSGFGSINSLKRALYYRTGLSVTEYKNQIRESNNKINPRNGQDLTGLI